MKDPEADGPVSDEKRRSRRRLLASLGMGVVGAYMAPTLFSLGQAHADHGGRHGSGRSRPSYSRASYSRPSYSRPSVSRPRGARSWQNDRYDRRDFETRRRLQEGRRFDDRYRNDDRFRRDDRYPRDEGDVIYETLRYLWPNG